MCSTRTSSCQPSVKSYSYRKRSRTRRPKVGQAYVSGIVTEADPAVMPDAVVMAVDDEAVQVLVGPAQHALESGVQVGDGAVAMDKHAVPDQRANAAQDDTQLVHHGLRVRERLRHCAIMGAE